MLDHDTLQIGKYIGEGKLQDFLETYTQYREFSKDTCDEIFNLLSKNGYQNKETEEQNKEKGKREQIIGEIMSGIQENEENISNQEKNILKQLCRTLISPILMFPKIEEIQEVVSEVTDISKEEMDIKTRKREIVQARQISMFFSALFLKDSLDSIGNTIGGKDHATVLHAKKTINNLIECDKKVQKFVYDVYIKLKKKYNIDINNIKEDNGKQDYNSKKNMTNLVALKEKEIEKSLSIGDKLLETIGNNKKVVAKT